MWLAFHDAGEHSRMPLRIPQKYGDMVQIVALMESFSLMDFGAR